MIMRALLGLGLAVSATMATAGPVSFDNGWKEQTFFRLNATDYAFQGQKLGIVAKDSSSVVYKAVPKADWGSTKGSWSWAVLQAVAATDLTKKGGDDRNIALYFVFLDQATAEKIGESASIRKLLTSKQARILVYVHGGTGAPGSFLPSPYLDNRGVTVIKRASGTGAHNERVDLAADYARAFGGTPEALVGIAVSSDSDDTDGIVQAEVSNLVLN